MTSECPPPADVLALVGAALDLNEKYYDALIQLKDATVNTKTEGRASGICNYTRDLDDIEACCVRHADLLSMMDRVVAGDVAEKVVYRRKTSEELAEERRRYAEELDEINF